GRIGKVLDYIKDIGADAIDPCEGPPDGDIPLKEVKRLVGDQMCIFGNIQLKLLENGTTDQVRSYVKDCMEAAKEGGHYVIMPTAAPINVPLSPRTEDNYKAFISASLEYGSYS
ncbi:MAG: uroporphyrinogen decarboxylase family protein, partial [Clostridia bacterium]|nr:uroporphyrinogen decarboxylase family protein [Clostridia bacterium]